MRRLRDESGQVMVLTVLSLAVLIGFVAFAVDIGMLLRAKRVVQAAADSAAIAAAAEMNYPDGDSVSAAQVDASQNGVTNGVNGTVTVDGLTANGTLPGPQSGAFAGNPAYVQVVVTQSLATPLINVFEALLHNPQLGNFTVSASATATRVPDPICIYALDPSGTDGIGVLSNSGTLSAPSCGILDYATSGSAISTQALAGGGAIAANSIGVVGGVDGGSIVPTPIPLPPQTPPQAPPGNDPLSSLTPPQPTSCQPGGTIPSTQTLGPAQAGGILCYNSGLRITGSNTVVTLLPGIYVFNGTGALQIDSGATVNGTGVTLYFDPTASSSFTVSSATVNLSAPTSDPYNGILFYQDPSDLQPMFFLSPVGGTLNGVVYAPAAQFSFTNLGSPGLNVTNASFVVGSFFVAGGATVQGYAPEAGYFSPQYVPRLAE